MFAQKLSTLFVGNVVLENNNDIKMIEESFSQKQKINSPLQLGAKK